MEGRLGMEITLVPSSGLVLVVGSAVLILLNFDLLFVLKFASLSCWRSFSLALKGLGRRSLMGEMTTEGVSVGAIVEVKDKDALLADGDILADPNCELPGTELDLPCPLLNKLELARNPGLELLPNDGVG